MSYSHDRKRVRTCAGVKEKEREEGQMGKVRNQPKTSGKLKFPFVDIDKGKKTIQSLFSPFSRKCWIDPGRHQALFGKEGGRG